MAFRKNDVWHFEDFGSLILRKSTFKIEGNTKQFSTNVICANLRISKLEMLDIVRSKTFEVLKISSVFEEIEAHRF